MIRERLNFTQKRVILVEKCTATMWRLFNNSE
jgi:hypothetical protein